MPYIAPENRPPWDDALGLVLEQIEHGMTPGDLNYVLTSICHAYVRRRGLNYTHLNDVVGVLEAAKLEFYRRVVAPYEDEKIKLNGDLL